MIMGYRCIGGPLDGEIRTQPGGLEKMEILEGPPLDWRHGANTAIRPGDVKVHVYRLREIENGRMAWVYVQ